MIRNTSTSRKVAILTESGFEQSELTDPKAALEEAGYSVEIISPAKGQVTGWDHDHWGITLPVDKHVTEVTEDEYAALILPGGVLNPDKLRIDKDSIEFIKDFLRSGKIVAAICHGPQSLIEAKAVEGKRLTSYPSIKVDLTNAGATWVDEEVTVDGNLITSRKPSDLPAFTQKILEHLEGGKSEQRDLKVFSVPR